MAKKAAKKGSTTAKPAGRKTATKPKAPARQQARLIKVMATKMGYYDHLRRRVGDVFLIPERMFSSKWMERVSPRTPEKVTTAEEALEREHEDIKRLKNDGAAPGTEADPIGDNDDEAV